MGNQLIRATVWAVANVLNGRGCRVNVANGRGWFSKQRTVNAKLFICLQFVHRALPNDILLPFSVSENLTTEPRTASKTISFVFFRQAIISLYTSSSSSVSVTKNSP